MNSVSENELAAISQSVVATPRKGRLNKWKPKKWRPEYDRIVAYSALGKSNVWISQHLEFTPEHVSVILNLPEAKQMLDKLQTKMRERIEVNIPEVMGEISKQAVLRIKAVMFDDALFEKSPFHVIDRGMEILKGLSHLKGGGNGAPQQAGPVTNIGTVVISQGQRSDILDGLEKIAEVKKLHSGTGSDDGA